jgi:hypothetical protein
MVTKFLTATFAADPWTVRALRLRRDPTNVVIILRMPLASTEASLAARQGQPNVDVDDQRTGTYSAQGGSLTGAARVSRIRVSPWAADTPGDGIRTVRRSIQQSARPFR